MSTQKRNIVTALGVFTVGVAAIACLQARDDPQYGAGSLDRPTLADAQTLFYNGRYDSSAALTLALRSSQPEDLASYELRTSALLFQLKAVLKGRAYRDNVSVRCATCPELISAFLSDTRCGQVLARTRLRTDSSDESALFFLGKLDLNYVWLQLESLGRKTGWGEYWEARRSLDAVLKQNPGHVRARVARAWIDYIVDTELPRGTHWVLGGGSRERALMAVRQAASTETEFFSHAEAKFALWDMQIRERNTTQAIELARGLAHDFPRNRQLADFLGAHDPGFRP